MKLAPHGGLFLSLRQKYHYHLADAKRRRMVKRVLDGHLVLPSECYADAHIQTADLAQLPEPTRKERLAMRATNYYVFSGMPRTFDMAARCLPWNCDEQGRMSRCSALELFEVGRRCANGSYGLSPYAAARGALFIISASTSHFYEPVTACSPVHLRVLYMASRGGNGSGGAPPDAAAQRETYLALVEMWSGDRQTLHAVSLFEIVLLGPASLRKELSDKYRRIDCTGSGEAGDGPSQRKTVKLDPYHVLADTTGIQLKAVEERMLANREHLPFLEELEQSMKRWRSSVRNDKLSF